ncbi:hypothetical protein A3D14_03800 [Candidatus Saccharibacteria bacterium RIFCSPHIGHO2_02_FULL_47_12]|nr:MAG: hypothetical protein A3D14_03800 [Candidatus Saccharibacteria bacterium RIFCSPHIGHO2_02_FULL_47_12]
MTEATYLLVIFYSLIGGVFSLLGGLLMLSRKKLAELLADYATPFAAGALLAAVFMDLLKEGLEVSSSDTVLLASLVGLVAFFFAERFLHWFHHHHQHDLQTAKLVSGRSPKHRLAFGAATVFRLRFSRTVPFVRLAPILSEKTMPASKSEGRAHHIGDPTTSLIIIGDTVHNALDGVAIAAAFLISVPTGIVTTIAVAAHEIPQEVGDFGLLLARGVSRAKVLLVNIMSALATTLLAVITFTLGSEDRLPLGWLIGISAGFLLYIATSDIIPEIHEKAKTKRLFELQPILLLVGVVVVSVVIQLAHRFVE